MSKIDWARINDLAHELGVRDIVATTHEEIKRTAEVGIGTVLKRLNIVSREEFVAQSELLAQMCKRVQEMQEQLDGTQSSAKQEKAATDTENAKSSDTKSPKA